MEAPEVGSGPNLGDADDAPVDSYEDFNSCSQISNDYVLNRWRQDMKGGTGPRRPRLFFKGFENALLNTGGLSADEADLFYLDNAILDMDLIGRCGEALHRHGGKLPCPKCRGFTLVQKACEQGRVRRVLATQGTIWMVPYQYVCKGCSGAAINEKTGQTYKSSTCYSHSPALWEVMTEKGLGRYIDSIPVVFSRNKGLAKELLTQVVASAFNGSQSISRSAEAMAAVLYQTRGEQLALIVQHLGRIEGAEFTRALRMQMAANLGVNDPQRWMETQMPSQ